MSIGKIAVVGLSGGAMFVLADGLDRLLATYSPSAAERPKDKFTSSGAGTLANTLNIASRPGLIRIGAGVGTVLVPAFASRYVRSPMMRASLEGATIGATVSLFKMAWNNFLMPLLIGKDVSPAALQKSYIARLYPSEVSAKINRDQQQAPPGALSGADVGPFALAADSPYPDAGQALRQAAGVHGDSPYPSASQAMGVQGDSPYPSAAQALRREAGMSAPASDWAPGPPPGTGPGPQPADSSCGCGDQFAGFIGDAPESDAPLTMMG